MFTPNVIPNKHTAKVKSNKKRPSKKLGFDFCISVEYKIKRKFTVFRQIPNIFHLVRWKYQHFHSCYALVKNTDFFHRTRWNIFGIHLKKVNILYLLHGVISLPNATLCDKRLSIWSLATVVINSINRLFAYCKGGNVNTHSYLGVVRLFHLPNKGNQVLFIIWWRIDKLFGPRKRACISWKP